MADCKTKIDKEQEEIRALIVALFLDWIENFSPEEINDDIDYGRKTLHIKRGSPFDALWVGFYGGMEKGISLIDRITERG